MGESSFHVTTEGHGRLCWILKLCYVIKLHEIAYWGFYIVGVFSRSEDSNLGSSASSFECRATTIVQVVGVMCASRLQMVFIMSMILVFTYSAMLA
jgi:hypothetical protein